jgi:putative tryptophan/tyrosine transport system substrate-binding protein
MRLIGLAVVLTVIVAVAPLAVEAQPAGRTVTIGYLGNSSPSHESHLVEALREGLRQLGYVEGRNLTIKYAWADGRPDRFPVLARELVELKPDVILTSGTPGALAAKQATSRTTT